MQPKYLAIFLCLVNLAACAQDRDDDDGDGKSSESAESTPDEKPEPDASGQSMTRSDAGTEEDEEEETCPDARPSESTACDTSALCTYDEIECRCTSEVWSCEEPVNADCPSSMPASGETCDLPEATECDYLEQECECLSGEWTCESEADEEPLDGSVADGGTGPSADAGSDAGSCPQARPRERTACMRSDDTCTYDDTQCMCPTGTWSCSEPVDMGCPATAPLHGDRCSGRADCDFLEVECECLQDAWNCKPND